MANGRWFVRNSGSQRDLPLLTVKDDNKRFARKHEAKLHYHVKKEDSQLLDSHYQILRLKDTKSLDLPKCFVGSRVRCAAPVKCIWVYMFDQIKEPLWTHLREYIFMQSYH